MKRVFLAVRYHPSRDSRLEGESGGEVPQNGRHDGPNPELQLCGRPGQAAPVQSGRHTGQGHLRWEQNANAG